MLQLLMKFKYSKLLEVLAKQNIYTHKYIEVTI